MRIARGADVFVCPGLSFSRLIGSVITSRSGDLLHARGADVFVCPGLSLSRLIDLVNTSRSGDLLHGCKTCRSTSSLDPLFADLFAEVPHMEGIFRRRRLPHFDVDGGIYFVTSCLAGSLPAQGRLQLQQYRDELEQRERPVSLSAEQWGYHKDKLVFARFDQLIDTEPGARHLADPQSAAEVAAGLMHFAGIRYQLFAYVVMPSHFHWVFQPTREWFLENPDLSGKRTPRERIMQSVKSFTAKKCNALLSRTGAFWQDESYDHVVRDDDELLRILEYVENNPVRAGLVERQEDWEWSSARLRKKLGIARGKALMVREPGR